MKLIAAAAQGNLDEVRSLLAAGSAVDKANEYGHTALMEAASQGHAGIVRLLLEAGADPRRENSLALDFAVRLGNANCVSQLLSAGADPNRLDAQLDEEDEGDDPGSERCQDPTLLMEAVARGNVTMVNALLAAGADPQSTAGGQGPLATAVQTQKDELFEVLLEAGAAKDGALRAAAAAGRPELVERLLELGVPVEDTPSQFGGSPLSDAAYAGHAEVVRILIAAGADLEHVDSMDKTPLAQAVQEGKTAAARLLLEAGASMESGDDDSLLTTAVWMDHPSIVDLLLEHSADPNERRHNSPPPLFWAIAFNKTALASRLLAAGADANAKMPKGRRVGEFSELPPGATPLMLAAKKGRGKIVEALLEAGADPNVKDGKQRTAGDYAAKAGHVAIVARLSGIGGEVSVSASQMQSAALLRAVRKKTGHAKAMEALDRGADPAAVDKNGVSALTWAVQVGLAEVVQRLLQAGADPNATSTFRLAPLRTAAVRENPQITRLLLEAGANPNAPQTPGSIPADKRNTVFISYSSPLHDAAAYGLAENLELLLESGANVNATGDDGLTPLVVAVNHRQMAMADRLLSAGALVRPQDEQWLAPYRFAKAAEAPAFRQLVDEVGRSVGAPPQAVDHLPGVFSYRIDLAPRPETPQPADPIEAGRQWGRQFSEEYSELIQKSDAALEEIGDQVRQAGFLLLDAGMPLGCGPMTRFLALLPTADMFAAMVAFGVRGNDQELPTGEIVDWFRELEKDEPFDLRAVKFDTVGIEFHALVKQPEDLALRMCDFCHDLAGGDDGVAKVAEHLRTNRRIVFWWD